MTMQAVVVSRKMDTPTAVVAMLGIVWMFLSSCFMLYRSVDTGRTYRHVHYLFEKAMIIESKIVND